MSDNPSNNYFTLVSSAIIGYILVVAINYTSEVFELLTQLLAILISLDSYVIFYLDLLDNLTSALIWGYLVYKSWQHLKSSNIVIENYRKILVRIIIVAVICYIISPFLTLQKDILLTEEMWSIYGDQEQIRIKAIITTSLNYLEGIVILFGLYRLLANMNKHVV